MDLGASMSASLPTITSCSQWEQRLAAYIRREGAFKNAWVEAGLLTPERLKRAKDYQKGRGRERCRDCAGGTNGCREDQLH